MMMLYHNKGSIKSMQLIQDLIQISYWTNKVGNSCCKGCKTKHVKIGQKDNDNYGRNGCINMIKQI